MKQLTLKQKKIFDFIKTHVSRIGFPPSVREIAASFKISTRAAYDHLRAIEKKGYIRRDPMKPRAIEIVSEKLHLDALSRDIAMVPLVGRVAAGQPVLAEENIEDRLPFPVSLVGHGQVFALRVYGDSMIEDGILDGDYVLVRSQPTAELGETVVALMDDEATVKRFYRDHDKIRLQPANSSMEPIFVNHVNVLGKVIGVFRNLRR